MQGFVYILRSESFPGLLKIGKTSRTPTDRCNELFTTGLPFPFEVVFAVWSGDADRLESDIHEELIDDRVNDYREFFKTNEVDAIERLVSLQLSSFSLTVVDSEMEIDRGSASLYASLYGCHPFCLPDVLDQFTPNEWVEAGSRLKLKILSRRARSIA